MISLLAIVAALIHTTKLIFGLLEGANESTAVTGVFNLIRQMAILKSRKLDALFEMCDSWEGVVRCRAIQLLNMLREEHSIWRRKLSTFARTLETSAYAEEGKKSTERAVMKAAMAAVVWLVCSEWSSASSWWARTIGRPS